MEGMPKQENVENTERWRQLKAEAPARAEALIEEIGDVSISERMNALDTLFQRLQESGNENRYVAKYVSLERARLSKEEERKQIEQEHNSIIEAQGHMRIAV